MLMCSVLRFGVTTCVFFPVWSQVAIMAQGGFALLKQVAAVHLGNAAVQEQLWWAVRNLTYNNADNRVRRPDGGHVVMMRAQAC